MKRWKKIVLAAVALVLVAGAVLVIPTIWGKPWQIEHFYARVFIEYMLAHPQLVSSLGVFDAVGLDFHNDELNEYSLAADYADVERAEKALETLRSYDRTELEDQLSYDVLEWFLVNAAHGREWVLYGYPVNQHFGFQNLMPDFMVNTHRIDDAEGAEDYLARLRGFEKAFQQMVETLREQEAAGIMPPRFVYDRVLEEMREFIAGPVEEHLLVSHFEEELAKLDTIDDQRRRELIGEARAVVGQTVYPAYEHLIEYCAGARGRTTTDDGVWKLPNGRDYYNYRLRSSTTTTMTADEIHQLGLQEIERIQAEMYAILSAEGLPTESLADTMAALNQDPRFLYPDNDEGRQQILEDYSLIIQEMKDGLGELFSLIPRADVVVKRVPEFREETAPGAYYDGPPMDGSRSGVFYVNLGDVKEVPRFGMRTLAYHEAIPGHHLQIALAREMEGVPFFRRVIPFTSYSEGWALYAEQLAAESGFQDDPYDRLGYLVAQAMRAVRLIVDTGIHSQKWTRGEAIAYMLENTGMPEGEVISEVERYIVDPGQATAYMVGYLEIMRLRQEAKTALGDGFDLRDFHRVILENGALPLTLLRAQVEDWIARS